MTVYFMIGGGVIVLACVVWLVWFSYRAGKTRASVLNARAAAAQADAISVRAHKMAQAQANAPTGENAVLARLDGGSA